MGKLAQSASKYIIYINFQADGTVEKPDVIGAVFGQTEGLLGADMDLRELQKTGRVGRIDVNLRTEKGKTSGVITIPSSLDSSETALLAATMETIERIGPCNTKLQVEKIDDSRIGKRKYVVDRAQQLLETMGDGDAEIDELSEQIKSAVRSGEIVEFQGLPAGPDVGDSDSIIVVEGRADVLKLLKNGIRNAIAVQGTSVPPIVASLSKIKETTVFLDGDRGGDMILKELAAVGSVDFVARAPEGKEVEDLSKKELFKALREKQPYGKEDKFEKKSFDRDENKSFERTENKTYESKPYVRRKMRVETDQKQVFKEAMNQLSGSKGAYYFGKKLEAIGKVPIKEIYNTIRESKAETLVLDGPVDQKIADLSARNGIKTVVGTSMERMRIPRGLKVITLEDLE
ncbi:MAG: DNA primase [Nanoarchaeota archaeon]|nr:DNA primase [Nanoarchaeota archaeon]